MIFFTILKELVIEMLFNVTVYFKVKINVYELAGNWTD